jgi:hypothetical protein
MTYRLPCPVVREPEDDREPEMAFSKSKIYTIWTNGTAASLDARATRDSPIAAKLQPEHKKVRKGDRSDKGDERDLLHSAHESRVAPRLRFLGGSGAGDGSRLLGDGEDMIMGEG